MKPAIRKSVNHTIGSFTVKELWDPYFDPNWHFHPEYQLFLVLEGTGTRFIGDNIKTFEPGDLVFIGPNLPHLWRSDQPYFEPDSTLQVHGIVVYFSRDFLGNGFFDKPEMLLLNQLLQRSERGLDILGCTREQVGLRLQHFLKLSGFNLILQLLEILHILSEAQAECPFISSTGFTNSYKKADTPRMQQVHHYVLNNFKGNIQLNDIAAIANMSPAAFCRYFKARANKTFSDFVTEVRIGHACKLLMEEKLSVTQICYECGFKTLSNFNRQFKEITRLSPLRYQKKYVQ